MDTYHQKILDESMTEDLAKYLEQYGSPKQRFADRREYVCQISIRDDSTMIDQVYVTDVPHGKVIVCSNLKLTFYFPANHYILRNNPNPTLDTIRSVVSHFNHGLKLVGSATILAFLYYLYKKHYVARNLPRWIDVAPLRYELIKNEQIPEK